MDATISIDRTALTLPPLEFSTDCKDSSLWISLDGLERPTFDILKAYAPESAWVPGNKLLVAGSEVTTLNIRFIIDGESHADLSDKIEELEEAVSQFFYEVTMTIDGQTEIYEADSTLPIWGEVEYLLQHLMKIRGVLQIPVYR